MANRTIQFHGLAYGDVPVQMNAHINGQLVFSGTVTTNPGPIPSATPEGAGPLPHPVLFSAVTDLFPIQFAGHYPMTVSVASGDGIILDEVTCNYMSPGPGPVITGSMSGTTLTVTSGTVEAGMGVYRKVGDDLQPAGVILSGSGTTWEMSKTREYAEGSFVTTLAGDASTFTQSYNGGPANAENNYDPCSQVTIDGIDQLEPAAGELGQQWWVVEQGSTWACQLYISPGA